MRAAAILAAALLLAAPARAQAPETAQGQTVYVPVYSHILHGNRDAKGKPQSLPLSSMLSIRNTDPGNPMVVRSVRYYDTEGRLLRELVTAPVTLGPMGSTDLFVENKDDTGGTGANFLVVWTAARPIATPIIETVNAYFFGPHSMAFTSPGKVIGPAP